MKFTFPAAFATNTLAMTALLICFGLAGETSLAADIGIVQGATLAIFFALSANARNLILNPSSPVSAKAVLLSRVILLVPIAVVTYWLSTSLADVRVDLAMILILRRSVEWLGEVHLSELERTGESRLARHYLLSQVFLLLLALVWELNHMPAAELGLFLWALLPLGFSARFILESLQERQVRTTEIWRKLLPHFGSTTIIGIGVYVFRLLLLLILGKQLAGELFTAFAMGGVLGSVFANALGPSIVLAQQRTGSSRLPASLRVILLATSVVGIGLICLSYMEWQLLQWTGKSLYFWGAVGYSLLGGAVMVYAQILRLKILQNHEDSDLFGPDTIMNIIIIMAVPLLSDILGTKVLATLYLFSALLALTFYWSYEQGEKLYARWKNSTQEIVLTVIAASILLPVFIQLGSGIFSDTTMLYETHGSLKMLPIPISVIACYIGIALLGEYRRATISLSFLFFSCIFMLGTTVAGAQHQENSERDKLTLLIQFMIPMFGLVLGEIYAAKEKVGTAAFAKAIFATLIVIVPVQLFSTWQQGTVILSPYLYAFSIYGHLQYGTGIITAAFLLAFSAFWQEPRYQPWLVALTPLMGIYVAASQSVFAIMLLIIGLIVYTLRIGNHRTTRNSLLLTVVTVVILVGYMYQERHHETFEAKFLNHVPQQTSPEPSSASSNNASVTKQPSSAPQPAPTVLEGSSNQAMPNISDRVDHWNFYTDEITSSLRTLLLGHAKAPDRNIHPSAHNYYLDLTYHFGLIGLAPMIGLVGYLLSRLYKFRYKILRSPQLLHLAMVVIALLLIDNSLKVGLRQPYPGIFTFFIIGLLIGRLSKLKFKSNYE